MKTDYNSMRSMGVFKTDVIASMTDSSERLRRALFWILLMTFLLFGSHPISGSSMYPTYESGQTAVSFKAVVPLHRGDVVVAFSPGNKLLIKRLIGMPGDVVEIDAEGKTYVNGELSPYGEGDANICCTDEAFPVEEDGVRRCRLGKGEYMIMGDNRENSSDGRSFGPIHRWDFWEVVVQVF